MTTCMPGQQQFVNMQQSPTSLQNTNQRLGIPTPMITYTPNPGYYLEFCIVSREKSSRHFSDNRVIDSVYQTYTLMNTHEPWWLMVCANVYFTTELMR